MKKLERWKRTSSTGLVIGLVAWLGLAGQLLASGASGGRVDQSQLLAEGCAATFGALDLAQSFTPALAVLCGAEIAFTAQGSGGDVTIELWDALPNAGGAMLATGTAYDAAAGETVQVSWCPTPVTPGSTYYLVFTGTDPVMCLDAASGDPYPGGMVFATPGYQPFPDFDYTFQTYGLDCLPDQEQSTATGPIASFDQGGLAQSFSPDASVICGAAVRTLEGTGTGGDVTVELWDRLPNDDGHLLRSGTATEVAPGEWVTVSWPKLQIDVSRQYFLVITSTSDMTLAGSSDIYPGGVAHFFDFFPFPVLDFAFKTFAEPCGVDVSQPDPGLCIAQFMDHVEFGQSFVPNAGSMSGAEFKLAASVGGVGDVTIELWDDPPSQGGSLLASGTDYGVDGGAGEWARVEWNAIAVTSGDTYYLIFSSTDGTHCVSGTLFDSYPGGDAWANGSSFGADVTFATFACQFDCQAGSVNQTAEVVLTVNGLDSADGAWVPILGGGAVTASIAKPSSGGNGKFLVHANWGAPTDDTTVDLPGQIGQSCFDLLIVSGGGTGSPAAVWNNIGKVDRVGATTYFDGTAGVDPMRAPTDFLDLPAGDAVNLPVGIVVTFEGVIIDPNTSANKPVSKTNAVTIVIQ